MNNFNKAVRLTLEKEGVLSNDPQDTGGLTKYGIASHVYPNLDIQNLTKEQAVAIYKRDYWDKAKCELFPCPIDILLFDTAVNHGVASAIKLLQNSLGIKSDGIVGPKTLEAAQKAEKSIYSVFLLNRLFAYTKVKSWPTFKNGWKNRLVKLASELNV